MISACGHTTPEHINMAFKELISCPPLYECFTTLLYARRHGTGKPSLKLKAIGLRLAKQAICMPAKPRMRMLCSSYDRLKLLFDKTLNCSHRPWQIPKTTPNGCIQHLPPHLFHRSSIRPKQKAVHMIKFRPAEEIDARSLSRILPTDA